MNQVVAITIKKLLFILKTIFLIQNPTHQSPLDNAILIQQLDHVYQIIKDEKTDLNLPNKQLIRPILLAIASGSKGSMNALIYSGKLKKNINYPFDLGATVQILNELLNQNEIDTIKLLMANDFYVHNKPLTEVLDDPAINGTIDEINNYKINIANTNSDSALIDAITHYGDNQSELSEDEWTNFSFIKRYNKQLLYAVKTNKLDPKALLNNFLLIRRNLPTDLVNVLLNMIDPKSADEFCSKAKKLNHTTLIEKIYQHNRMKKLLQKNKIGLPKEIINQIDSYL